MHIKWNIRSLIAAIMLPVLLLAAAACGSDSQDETAVAASATAEHRDQTITRFGAGTLTATVAPTPRDSSQPTPKPTVTYTGPPTRNPGSSNEQVNPDRLALEELFLERSQAFSAGDYDAWYATCSASLRETARSNDSLGERFQSLGIDPPPEVAFEFIVDKVNFKGSNSATVDWGLHIVGVRYVPGAGVGSYVKEDGEWYSMGWGCV